MYQGNMFNKGSASVSYQHHNQKLGRPNSAVQNQMTQNTPGGNYHSSFQGFGGYGHTQRGGTDKRAFNQLSNSQNNPLALR